MSTVLVPIMSYIRKKPCVGPVLFISGLLKTDAICASGRHAVDKTACLP